MKNKITRTQTQVLELIAKVEGFEKNTLKRALAHVQGLIETLDDFELLADPGTTLVDVIFVLQITNDELDSLLYNKPGLWG
jgi:hypothetical protein